MKLDVNETNQVVFCMNKYQHTLIDALNSNNVSRYVLRSNEILCFINVISHIFHQVTINQKVISSKIHIIMHGLQKLRLIA